MTDEQKLLAQMTMTAYCAENGNYISPNLHEYLGAIYKALNTSEIILNDLRDREFFKDRDYDNLDQYLNHDAKKAG